MFRELLVPLVLAEKVDMNQSSLKAQVVAVAATMAVLVVLLEMVAVAVALDI